jgi:GNAT superfamily N-acetyltransferase
MPGDVRRLRSATVEDLPRIHQIRHGRAGNPLVDPARVTNAEVEWYLRGAIFLVSEEAAGVQGFTCVNHLTSYVWALFVIDGAHGRGQGTALLGAGMARLRQAGPRQSHLSTGQGTRAESFYSRRGRTPMGLDVRGEVVFRLWL